MVNKFGIGIGDSNDAHSTRGFTLMELLVALAVFSVVTIAVIANFRRNEHASELRIASKAVANTLQEMQNRALVGTQVELCPADAPQNANKVCSVGSGVTCDGCAKRVPLGGYGVKVRGEKDIFAFADANADFMYDTGEKLVGGDINLPSGVSIDVNGSGYGVVVFIPPDGRVSIAGQPSELVAAFILGQGTLQSGSIIRVYSISGRIEIE